MERKIVFPSWVWLVYCTLFVFSIPWYIPKKLEMQLFLGLPLWLIACIGTIVITAIFTTWIIWKYWEN